jgi:deazaflavin-dependent oxidoreductase (nitroreductase family)
MPNPPPAWAVRANVALLRRGLRIGSQSLLTVRGRRSGELRRTPISVVTVDGSRYLVAAFEDADWVKNVRAAGEGELARGRDAERVRLTEVPIDRRGPILRTFLDQVPGGRRFFGADDPDVIAAEAGRYPVFKVASAKGARARA